MPGPMLRKLAATALATVLALPSGARAEGAAALPAAMSRAVTAAMTDAMAASRETAFRQAVAEAAAPERDLAEFYRARDYRPVWTGDEAAHRERRAALLHALDTADLHALPAPSDRSGLIAHMSDIRSPRERGAVEVALSRAFIAHARAVGSGVLVPGRVVSGIKRDVPRRSAADLLSQVAEGDPRAAIRALPPQTNEYRRLMKERLRLAGLVADGGWGARVQAGKLEPGDSGAAVIALRDRLVAMGYLGRGLSGRYDGTITAAVRAFQADHGLATDGIAGPATIEALNVPAADRLSSVIVAMERERWLPAARGARHILVNLADFSARILDADSVTFETRAVVGKNSADRRSPEFSDEMDHMIVNPTWHVPRSITVREYLPKMQANPNAVGHLRLYDSRGRQVPRSAVDFRAHTARSFPYRLKQPPSNSNALGLVKFMFPNRYNIYLHDTPQKHLFGRSRRDFSHGCIRLAEPFEFAYALLAPQEADPKRRFHRALDSGRETRIDLERHVPVHLIYRTAVTQATGRMQYRDDVYGRDARIWAALEQAGVRPLARGG